MRPSDLQKVCQWAKSNHSPSEVYNAACRMLDELNGPDGAAEGAPLDRFAAGLRVIGRAVADANSATQQDFALTGPPTLGPNREGCNDPECSRTECLHLGICWEDAFWGDGPNGSTPEKRPESHENGRTTQTQGASEGQATNEAQEGSQ